VLAGQSKMAGRGEPLSLASPSDPRLLIWRTSGWQVAADPLQLPTNAKDRRPGIGPGMIFGLQLLKWQSGVQVGLIMCADGGSSIRAWLPDGPCTRNASTRSTPPGAESTACCSSRATARRRPLNRPASGCRSSPECSQRSVVTRARRRSCSDRSALSARNFEDSRSSGMPKQRRLSATTSFSSRHRICRSTPRAAAHFTVHGYRVLGNRFATVWWRATKLRAATAPTPRRRAA
jgi:hypothetical protein